ncbi:hypothetical protein M0Q28_01610 [Patescibacteria group bacterium]|jgi:hypothetical protein|nr:hypothetical protein [Patescibacteria group bacterium]
MLKNFRTKLQGKLGLAAVLFGCLLFLFLSVSTVLFFNVFWSRFKDNSLLSYLFIPAILLQIPGWLFDGFIQVRIAIRAPGMNPNIEGVIISFYSSIFWSLVAYGLLRFERWWDARKK